MALALDQLDAAASEAVLIGDSTTDIEAAHAAGTAAIAYVNKPGKRDRLTAIQPDTLIEDLDTITAAVTPVDRHRACH